jgi:toxin ParE1/3/4
MTGGINFTPEPERHLNKIDDWITKRASADIAQRFVSAILDHIETIPAFPYAGGATTSGQGMRTTTFKTRPSSPTRPTSRPVSSRGTSLAFFHGGQDWEAALGEEQVDGDP